MRTDEVEDVYEELPGDFTGEVIPPPIVTAPFPPVDTATEPIVSRETPQAPEIDVESIKRDAIAEYQQQVAWQQQQAQRPSEAPVQPTIYDTTTQRIFDGDAPAALRDFGNDIENRVRTQMQAEFDRRLAPIAGDRLVEQIAGDYGTEAKSHIRELTKGLDPSALTTQGLELFKRVARDVDREAKEKTMATQARLRPEPVGQEAPKIRINRSHFDDMNEERAKVGLPKFKVEEYNKVMKEGPYGDGN